MASDANPLTVLSHSLAEKPPGTVKELAKALVDLASRLEQVTTNIRADIQSVATDYKASHTEMQDLMKSVMDMSLKFEQFKTDVQNVCRDVSAVTQRQLEDGTNTNQLKVQVSEMRQEIIQLKQYSRRNNLEIKGVPPTAEESLPQIMLTLADCLKTDLSVKDIDAIHRVPTKDKNKPNIVVKFISRERRDQFMLKAKKQRLTTSVLGLGSSEPIYVNDHLCTENKVLLGKAIQAKRDKNWKFAWVTEGKILMRKTENSRVLRIMSEEDLEKVV